MGDAQPVELGRQARDLDLPLAQAHPACLEPPPAHARGEGHRDDERRAGQIWSFSRTGWTETTCRLNFSSDSWSPAATPTSCER